LSTDKRAKPGTVSFAKQAMPPVGGGRVKPVRVDIITYAPTAFFHCQHCEVAFHHLGIGPRMRSREADDSLPLDLQFEYLDLSIWVRDLIDRLGGQVKVRVIDAASLAGVWASMRHRVRSYPAVIVEGGPKRTGGEFRDLDPVIDRLVAANATNEGDSTT